MAFIKKLPSGRWQARYRDLERREHSKNFRTKTKAQDWLDENTADLVRGDWRDPRSGRIPVEDLAADWYAATGRLTPSTRASYRGLLDAWVLPRWRRVEVRAVEHGAVAAWVASIDRSPSTVRKAYGVLRSILDLAVRDRRIPSNPAVGVRLPRLPMIDMRFLSAEELERLAAAMPTERDRVLTLVLGWCGLRFGEAAALGIDDVDPLRRRIRVRRSVTEVRGRIEVGEPKTHAARSVPMPSVVVDAVAGYRSGSDLAFPDEHGGYLRVTNWHRRTFDSAAVDAGLAPPPLRVHDLRHTCASLMIRSGASVKKVQAALGHAKAAMTLDRYSHLFPDDLDSLADGLDRLRIADSRGFSADSSAVAEFRSRPS